MWCSRAQVCWFCRTSQGNSLTFLLGYGCFITIHDKINNAIKLYNKGENTESEVWYLKRKWVIVFYTSKLFIAVSDSIQLYYVIVASRKKIYKVNFFFFLEDIGQQTLHIEGSWKQFLGTNCVQWSIYARRSERKWNSAPTTNKLFFIHPLCTLGKFCCRPLSQAWLLQRNYTRAKT